MNKDAIVGKLLFETVREKGGAKDLEEMSAALTAIRTAIEILSGNP